MKTNPLPTEALLRINLRAGLTEDETAQISKLAAKLGGVDKAVLSVLQKGLSAIRLKRDSKQSA